MIRKGLAVLLFLSILITFSCNRQFKKVQKSGDPALKYATAMQYYQKEDYQRAMQLLDELLIYYRGNDTSEKINYYHAYSYYGMGDFIQAGYYFMRFANTFATSQYAEEALYMSAYCQYLFTPEYSLDQTISRDAIRQFQYFIDLYPESKRVEDCNKLIDELRAKLERKAYEIAKLYYHTEGYLAAMVSFKNLLKEFPDSRYREEAYFFILKASYSYAAKSIASKKLDRMNLAMDAYNAFHAIFPESKFSKEAKTIQKNIQQEIEKVKQKNT